jgi:8-oxo-dGTP pyrophosphatase MutT (NUDIX family)
MSEDPPPDPLADADERDPNPARGRPRDAATLILVRRDGRASPRLLMGRRGLAHAFMPAKWVFPGGRVDRADHRAPAASELRPAVIAALEQRVRRARPRSLARALAVAAVRETHEEAGLVLGRLESGRVLADLGALEFVARAVTPPGRVRRFDARFFLAEATALESLERPPGTAELEEIAWITPAEARALDLPSITRFVVDEVARRLEDPTRPVPFVRMVRGAKTVERL